MVGDMAKTISRELTIGEVAARSGVSVSALRFYERHGLIHSRRTAGNQRRYGRDVLRRIAFIRASQQLGIPLATIGEVLATIPPDQVPTREFWQRAAQCWSAVLDERIAYLERLRDRFTACIGCGCLSLDVCGLINPGDRLGEHGPGPRALLEP